MAYARISRAIRPGLLVAMLRARRRPPILAPRRPRAFIPLMRVIVPVAGTPLAAIIDARARLKARLGVALAAAVAPLRLEARLADGPVLLTRRAPGLVVVVALVVTVVVCGAFALETRLRDLARGVVRVAVPAAVEVGVVEACVVRVRRG